MQFLYRLKEEGGTWCADCVEVEAHGKGATAAEAVLGLRTALSERLAQHGGDGELELVPVPAPLRPAPKTLDGGEGNVEADRQYRRGVEQTLETKDVDGLAKEAKKALDGPGGDDLRRAERVGRAGASGARGTSSGGPESRPR